MNASLAFETLAQFYTALEMKALKVIKLAWNLHVAVYLNLSTENP